ncbi:MAG: MoaD/ThiS family protein [Azoarcus sp.]|jgi:molybdopterin converting factor small subunit|nr:MoaD/ThiS family protein [Azoarcus sp.]
MIRVLFFGPVAEWVGLREMELPFRAGLRWQDVRDEMRARYSEAFTLVALVAVNGERVDEEHDARDAPLADGAEIAFMSNFSGG